MSAWTGLIYKDGLARTLDPDWAEIDKLNLGSPAIMDVNNGAIETPIQSFLQLERGTTPSTSQCHTIGLAGIAAGTILVLRGNSGQTVTLLSGVGNLDLDLQASFGLTNYSTIVLILVAGWHEMARSDNN